MSAAVGKLGALTPTILFNYIDNRTKFWVVCWAGLVGCVLTLVFVPDATGEICIVLLLCFMLQIYLILVFVLDITHQSSSVWHA